MEAALEQASEAAKIGGVWQGDGSRHTVGHGMSESSGQAAKARVAARDGRPTVCAAYLFSGPQRRSSIAQKLREMYLKVEGDEIDILVGGREHDLLDSSAQEAIMARIAAGEYDIVIMSPLVRCGLGQGTPASPAQNRFATRISHGGFPTSGTSG